MTFPKQNTFSLPTHSFTLLMYLLVLELIAYSEASLRNNAAVVEYCRTSMAALSGGTAGLLGLTGLYGFGFYIFSAVGLWVSESNIVILFLYYSSDAVL